MKRHALVLALFASGCASQPAPELDAAAVSPTAKPSALVFTGKESCPDLWIAHDDAAHQAKLAQARLDRAKRGGLGRLTLGMGEAGSVSDYGREVLEWQGDVLAYKAEAKRRKCSDVQAKTD